MGIINIWYNKYWVSEISGIRNIWYQKYLISEVLCIRNIRYQIHKVKFHPKLFIYYYYYYLLTKPRYVFDFRSEDQSRSKNFKSTYKTLWTSVIFLVIIYIVYTIYSVDYTVQTFLFKVCKVWTIQPPSWLYLTKTKNNAQLMLATHRCLGGGVSTDCM